MSLHEDLTRVIEDARDHSRKDFNVVKESYGQYLARVVLASGVIAKVRAEALREAATWVEELAAHDGLMYREFDDGEEVAESIPDALRVRANRIEQGKEQGS